MKKNSIRFLSMALALILCLSLFAACGNGGADNATPTPLVTPTPTPAVSPEQPVEAEPEPLGTYISGGQNVVSSTYANMEGYPAFSDKAQWVGELSGTWYEIGRQLGEATADMVYYASDIWWTKMCDQLGVENTHEAMLRYEEQIAALDQGQIDYLKGITDGAADKLAQSKFSDESSENYDDPYYRVLAGSIWDSWLWGDPRMREGDQTDKDNSTITDSVTGGGIGGGCNSVAFLGAVTTSGSTISTQLRHTAHEALCYQAAYVIDTPDGNTVWTVGAMPATNGLMLINDKGVVIHHHFGGSTNPASMEAEGGPYYSDAFGVPWPNVLFYAAVHANTAEEAIEYLTLGSEAYRETTGRQTLLREGAWNWLVADNETLAVVEVNADRYAVRYAGEFTGEDWTDPNYIVSANHFLCDYSYDENNVRTDVPMTMFNVMAGSEERFWTLMWEAHDYLEMGKIDEYTVQRMIKTTYIRDRETGEKIYFAEDESGKMVPFGFVNWSVQGSLVDEGRVNGTNAAKISILNGAKSRALWTLGNPMDWEGAWDEFRFGN